MITVVADQRVVAATPTSIRWQPVDSSGEPTSTSPGTVTVGIARSDGSVLVAAGAATVVGSGDTPDRSYALTAAQTEAIDVLTATWTVAAVTVATTVVETVGGQLVTAADFRGREGSMTAQQNEAIYAARREVEDAVTDSCNRAFTRRLHVDRLSGSGSCELVLSWPDLREVRWARVYSSATDYTVFAADELAAIPPAGSGVATRTDGGIWPCGVSNVELGYVHGGDRPPADLVAALRRAIRQALTRPLSPIPDQSIAFQTIDGVNAQLATPGIGLWVTGIPYVDEVLKRYRFHRVGIG